MRAFWRFINWLDEHVAKHEVGWFCLWAWKHDEEIPNGDS